MTTAWPVCLGYLPVGLALGVLAQQSGIPWWAVAMMSILVFAGSAQFICIAMLTAGSSVTAIIFTTLVVNLRHTLMSSALAVHLRGVSRKLLVLFAYGITDESFAVNMAKFREDQWNFWQALTVNHITNSVWILSTIAGSLIGQLVPQGAFGIDYALTGMFICLLIYQLHDRIYVVTGLLSAAISVGWYLLIPGDSYIVGSSICAASFGFYLQHRYRRTK